jgi:carbohydrate diacid regulator
MLFAQAGATRSTDSGHIVFSPTPERCVMAIATTPFERVAEVVTERAADLLCAAVHIVDHRDIVIASSESHTIGQRIEPGDLVKSYVRMPIHLESGAGEIIVDEPGNGEVISPRLARVLVELVVNQTAVVDRLPNTHELKDKFIHDLLHGSLGDDTTILREAQILGMDLTPPRAVILIDAADYILSSRGQVVSEASEARIRRRVQLVIGRIVDFFELPNDTICAYIGDGEVAVLKASNRQNLASWLEQEDNAASISPSWAHLTALKRAGEALLTRLRHDTRSNINLGIGRYHPGLDGLSGSYADARAALSLGRRFHGQNKVHCLDSLGIAAFIGISDEETKVDLATYLLSPLDHEPDLLETLDAFFAAHCCPSVVAERLSIHRNTLSYRLTKITSLTGLDPRAFDDAVQIRLALLLRSLRTGPRSCAIAQ